MIIFDITKFVKHEKEKLYLKSRPIDFGMFCDYSKTEDLIEIEDHSGERSWYDIAPFFWNYPIREGRCIGIANGNKVRPYMIGAIETRIIRKKSILYASLSPSGEERILDMQADYPLNQLEHKF